MNLKAIAALFIIQIFYDPTPQAKFIYIHAASALNYESSTRFFFSFLVAHTSRLSKLLASIRTSPTMTRFSKRVKIIPPRSLRRVNI